MSAGCHVQAAAAQQGAGGAPVVSARLDGRANQDDIADPIFSGAQLQSDGDEFEYSDFGGLTNATTWLDSGNAADVWVERSIVTGSFNSIDPGAGRHQLSTTRSFRVSQSGTGTTSCTANFDFWDAASGGNNIQSTSNSVWSAEKTFNPCPLCCFTADTMITMADGKLLRIADVREGDKIMTVTEDGFGIREMEVTEVIVRINRPMYRIHFSNGAFLEASDDHPLHVKGKGATAVNPIIEYKQLGIPKVLEIGDEAFDIDGNEVQVVKIEPMEYSEPVFTFAESRFFANGILVY